MLNENLLLCIISTFSTFRKSGAKIYFVLAQLFPLLEKVEQKFTWFWLAGNPGSPARPLPPFGKAKPLPFSITTFIY